MRAARRWAMLGALACLSACAAPRRAAPARIAVAPTGIDGRYHGIARLTRATIAGCPRSGSRVVTIEDGALSLNYRGPRVSYPLTAVVGPNGAVRGSDGRGSIEGQISGRHLDLIVSSEFCEVRYALDRS